MALACTGLGVDNDHCCYVNGQECPFLEKDVEGRAFSCRLRRVMGSWQAVTVSFTYRPIGRHWQSIDRPFDYCRTFSPELCCRRGG